MCTLGVNEYICLSNAAELHPTGNFFLTGYPFFLLECLRSQIFLMVKSVAIFLFLKNDKRQANIVFTLYSTLSTVQLFFKYYYIFREIGLYLINKFSRQNKQIRNLLFCYCLFIVVLLLLFD